MIGVDVQPGLGLPTLEVRLTRGDLVRYCGASGDFNTIHWSQRDADAAGLPDVIAHGMLTMGLAARVVHGWTGDPARTVELSVRFSRPVPVPAGDGGVVVVFDGVIEAVGPHAVTISLRAHLKHDGAAVLQNGTAVVRPLGPFAGTSCGG